MATRAKKFDVIVIGAGSAGFSAAEAAHARGAKVCIIEQDKWGGECPNYACVPTKALLKSAKLYYQTANHLSDYGVHATSVRFNFKEIMKRKEAVVNAITAGGTRVGTLAKEMGMTAVKGSARFDSDHVVSVGNRRFEGKSIVIATGTTDFVPPIDGLHDSGFLGYRDVVSLQRMPSSVAVIGGGPVGCEFATFFGLLGANVHVLQLNPQILHRENAEIAAIAHQKLLEYGINVHVNTKTLSVKREGRKKRVTYQVGSKARQSVLVDHVILAAGKRANIEHLRMENTSVKLDSKGRLKMRETLQTSVDHIYAVGDVSGGMMFTHTAHHEGSIAGFNAMERIKKNYRRRNVRVVPRVTFTLPEVASVGMTPEEASAAKKSFMIGRFPIGALGRSVTEGERSGLLKLVVDKKTRKILGGHVIGEHAGEVIHEIALAMQVGAKVDVLAQMIHAFPTYSEAVTAAASM